MAQVKNDWNCEFCHGELMDCFCINEQLEKIEREKQEKEKENAYQR